MAISIAPWVSGMMVNTVPPNMTKMTINVIDQLNVPANIGWLLVIWYQDPANANWYPMMKAGDSALLVTQNNTITFSIPSGIPPGANYAIQVCGFAFPGDGSGPNMNYALFANSLMHGSTAVTVVGLNFPVPPPPAWGISQFNQSTSITINVVMSGGGGM